MNNFPLPPSHSSATASGKCPECAHAIAPSILLDVRLKVGVSVKAINLVLSALHDVTHREPGQPRHITARELCDNLLDFAIRKTGSRQRADDLLDDLGLFSGNEVGNIVYALVDVGLLRTQPGDSREQFDGIPLTRRAAHPRAVSLRRIARRSTRRYGWLIITAAIVYVAWLLPLWSID